MEDQRGQNLIQSANCYIQPGQSANSQDSVMIGSVCGNGVLVIVHDRIQKVGGVAHCVYPKTGLFERSTNYHADVAIRTLWTSLQRLNVSPRNCEAQLFGGGHKRWFKKQRAERVVRSVHSILKDLGVKIVSEDIGGSIGRKVLFNTESGEVLVHKTRSIRDSDWVPEMYLNSRV